MKAVRIAALALLCAASVHAVEIRSYDVRLAVSADGNAAGTAAILVGGAGAGTLSIPLGFGAGNVRLTGSPAGTTLTAQPFNGETLLRFELAPQPPKESQLRIAFDVKDALTQPEPAAGQKRVLPEGGAMLKHALVNTEKLPIRSYHCEVVFPGGLRAHAIREALPKPGKKESIPRVQLAAVDGREGARLQVATLRQGDSASMQIELVPRTRSPLWGVAGLLLSIAYLVFFRDLVAKSAPLPGGAISGGTK